MDVVVDSSVAIKWFVAEPNSSDAQRLLNEYQTGSLNFLAPDLIYAEIGNIVWKKQRFQGVTVADAQLIVDNFRTLTFRVTPSAELLNDAYRIAVTHQRSVYDAKFLALSVREKCRFVTADQRLVNALNARFSDLVWIGDWP